MKKSETATRTREPQEPIEAMIARCGRRIDGLMALRLPKARDPYLGAPIWHHMAGGGKRLRPVLCLLTCEALGGAAEKALPFALAVEILHNMLLVHDDVEDGDRVRRDRPTVWVKYGVPNAVNVGDYLLARAYSVILSSALPPRTITRLLAVFSETAEQTIRGQGVDIALRAAPDFTVRKYLKMVEWKTGRYLVLGMVGGAIVAGAPARVADSICTLGRTLGPTFQIRDDIIDLTVGKGRGGEVGCDIKEGKASIMYARALEVCGPEERRRLIRIMAKPREETTTRDVRWVMGLYRRRRCVQFAQECADRLVRKASRVIEGMPAASREKLKEIATYLARRSA